MRFADEVNGIYHNDFPGQNLSYRSVSGPEDEAYTESQRHYEGQYDKEIPQAADCAFEIFPAEPLAVEHGIAKPAYDGVYHENHTCPCDGRPEYERSEGWVDGVFGTKEDEGRHQKPDSMVACTAEAD